MASQWFYMKAGNRFGPVTARILQALATTGEIGPADLISREGSGTWVDAARVKGLFPTTSPAPRTPATFTAADDQYALEVASSNPSIKSDAPDPEATGKLELDGLSRFVFLNPLGLPIWVVSGGLLVFVFLILFIEKQQQDRHPLPDAFNYGVSGFVYVWWIGIFVYLRAKMGRQTACPRCNRWFAALLVWSDAHVIGSHQEVHTYTGQTAIRDRNFQVTGYIDEQRTFPITIKTVAGHRKYRCKTCQHRWEVRDVGRVIA